MFKTTILLMFTLSMLAGCKKTIGLSEIPKANESVEAINDTDKNAIKALDQNKKIKDLSPKDQDQVADVAYKLMKDPVKFVKSFCHVGSLGMRDKCEESRNDCVQGIEKYKDKLTSNKEKIKERIKQSEYSVKEILDTMLVLTAILEEFLQIDCGASEETIKASMKKVDAKAKDLGLNDGSDQEQGEKFMKIIATIFIGDELIREIMAQEKGGHGGKVENRGEHGGKAENGGGVKATPVGGASK